MKTTTYLFALLFFSAAHCAEQLPAGLVPIFNNIKHEIETANGSSAEWKLETFLQSDKAILLKEQLRDFSKPDKNKLIEKISAISTGGDSIRPQKRDFIAATIEAGAYIDTPLQPGEETFLGESMLHSDKAGVLFALKHKANTCLSYRNTSILNPVKTYILNSARTYQLASLLLTHKNNNDPLSSDHDTLIPFRNNLDQQFKLLENCVYDNRYSPELLKLYQQNGLDLTLSDNDNWTLFHYLCVTAADHQSQAFFQKFLTLFKADAINVDAKDKHDRTGLDILNALNPNNSTVKLAKALIEGLGKNPTLQMHRYKIKKDEPKK